MPIPKYPYENKVKFPWSPARHRQYVESRDVLCDDMQPEVHMANIDGFGHIHQPEMGWGMGLRKKDGNAVHSSQTHARVWTALITSPMRPKRQISLRRCRSKPPQFGQDLSCTAENTDKLIEEAQAPSFQHHLLRLQHRVFHKVGR